MKKLLTKLGIISLIVSILMGFAPPAFAWQICNHTPDDVWSAIAYDNGQGYISEGWWRLTSCGGCKIVYSGSPKLKGVFFHAHNQDRTLNWGDNNQFCVDDGNAFTLGPDENSVRGACEHEGFRLENFQDLVLPGDNHTTNLTGRRADGRVCID
jgi:uncharacterized membrane protein